MLDGHEECAHCHLKYELEPGFWLGALWTSYPIVIVLELPFLLGALLLEGNAIWYSFVGMVVAFFIAWPLMLRLGRSFWIHLNVRYSPPEEDLH